MACLHECLMACLTNVCMDINGVFDKCLHGCLSQFMAYLTNVCICL